MNEDQKNKFIAKTGSMMGFFVLALFIICTTWVAGKYIDKVVSPRLYDDEIGQISKKLDRFHKAAVKGGFWPAGTKWIE